MDVVRHYDEFFDGGMREMGWNWAQHSRAISPNLVK